MMKFLKKLLNRSTAPDVGQSRYLIPVPHRKGGVYVDNDTALTFSAVFACQRYLANSVAQLPWKVYKHRQPKGSDPAPLHPANFLLATRPNPEMRAFDFKRTMIHWAASWGNAYAEIEFDGSNRPVALWPVHPQRVMVDREESGELVYEIQNSQGVKTILPLSRMFHLAGMGADGISGYSVVTLAAASIGAGLAADEVNASFVQNGAVLSGGLKHPAQLSAEAYDRLKTSLSESHGGPYNAWKPMIFEEGMEWQSYGMPLKDAEFLMGRKFSVTEICRWFGVPPHKVADLERATYSNIEQQSIEVVTDSLMPWILPLEQEADAKLISTRNRSLFYTKMTVNALLRGDSIARGEYYNKMRNMGAISADEIRELEEMNPIGSSKGGDKYIVQGQYVPLEDVGKEPEVLPPPLASDVSEETDAVAGPDDDDEETAAAAYLRGMLLGVIEQAQITNGVIDQIKGLIERVGEPRLDLSLSLPEITIPKQDPPVVNIQNKIEAAEITHPPQEPPIVNITTPEIKLPAQEPPVVNVTSTPDTQITVVNEESKKAKKRIFKIVRDSEGKTESIEEAVNDE